MPASPIKYHINLLQAELLPETVLLTLGRVVILWGLILAMMIAWLVSSEYRHQSLRSQVTELQQKNSQYSDQFDGLKAQLSTRKVDHKLVEQLEIIKLLMTNKQALHAQLTNPNQTYVTGFATAMNELAQMHSKNIRLESIHLNPQEMTFTGLASSPEAVPTWLAGFENSLLLSGKNFEHFKLSENAQKVTQFVVSSKKVVEQVNE